MDGCMDDMDQFNLSNLALGPRTRRNKVKTIILAGDGPCEVCKTLVNKAYDVEVLTESNKQLIRLNICDICRKELRRSL